MLPRLFDMDSVYIDNLTMSLVVKVCKKKTHTHKKICWSHHSGYQLGTACSYIHVHRVYGCNLLFMGILHINNKSAPTSCAKSEAPFVVKSYTLKYEPKKVKQTRYLVATSGN